MKIIAFSDCHGHHERLVVPDGDVLIFAGDHCHFGDAEDVKKFAAWSEKLPHKYKLFVPGNHDRPYETDGRFEWMISKAGWCYLENAGIVIDGIRFYGSPDQPIFFNWAFNRTPEQLKKSWDAIPQDTQVLITHCPPYGYLDKTREGEAVGCKDLRQRVDKLGALNLHIFGHIHHSRGEVVTPKTIYANVSVCNERYELMHGCYEVEI